MEIIKYISTVDTVEYQTRLFKMKSGSKKVLIYLISSFLTSLVRLKIFGVFDLILLMFSALRAGVRSLSNILVPSSNSSSSSILEIPLSADLTFLHRVRLLLRTLEDFLSSATVFIRHFWAVFSMFLLECFFT